MLPFKSHSVFLALAVNLSGLALGSEPQQVVLQVSNGGVEDVLDALANNQEGRANWFSLKSWRKNQKEEILAKITALGWQDVVSYFVKDADFEYLTAPEIELLLHTPLTHIVDSYNTALAHSLEGTEATLQSLDDWQFHRSSVFLAQAYALFFNTNVILDVLTEPISSIRSVHFGFGDWARFLSETQEMAIFAFNESASFTARESLDIPEATLQLDGAIFGVMSKAASKSAIATANKLMRIFNEQKHLSVNLYGKALADFAEKFAFVYFLRNGLQAQDKKAIAVMNRFGGSAPGGLFGLSYKTAQDILRSGERPPKTLGLGSREIVAKILAPSLRAQQQVYDIMISRP